MKDVTQIKEEDKFFIVGIKFCIGKKRRDFTRHTYHMLNGYLELEFYEKRTKKFCSLLEMPLVFMYPYFDLYLSWFPCSVLVKKGDKLKANLYFDFPRNKKQSINSIKNKKPKVFLSTCDLPYRAVSNETSIKAYYRAVSNETSIKAHASISYYKRVFLVTRVL